MTLLMQLMIASALRQPRALTFDLTATGLEQWRGHWGIGALTCSSMHSLQDTNTAAND